MIKELDFESSDLINQINIFLKSNLQSDYMQSIEWNKVRNEQVKYYLYYIKNDEILWVCNLLEKEKNNKKILYAPRGPIMKEIRYINLFLEEIKKWMQLHNYNELIINPYISYDDLSIISDKYNYNLVKNNDYQNLQESCKLAIMDIIFDENKLIEKLPSKFRQNTRRSYRKGLRSNISKKVNFENFYKLYNETAIRHNFHPHTIEYFKNLVNQFNDKFIFLEVWYKDKPLAMSIDIVYNNKLIYLYGVSSTENRNLLGMYNMQWEAIRYCINNKIPKYDFGGVFCDENEIDNKDFGLYQFKKGYCYNGFLDIVPDIIFNFGGVNND